MISKAQRTVFMQISSEISKFSNEISTSLKKRHHFWPKMGSALPKASGITVFSKKAHCGVSKVSDSKSPIRTKKRRRPFVHRSNWHGECFYTDST